MVRSKSTCVGVSWGALLLAACNASVVDPIGGGPGEAGQSSQSAMGGNGNSGQNAIGAAIGGESTQQTDCTNIAAEVSAQVAYEETCSLVVRLDSLTLLLVKGHTLICGPRKVVDEAGARAADAATSLFQTNLSNSGSAELLSGAPPHDVWLFRLIMGGVAHVSAVSATSGQTLFWAPYYSLNDANGPTVAGLVGGTPMTPNSRRDTAWTTTEIGDRCYVAPPLPGWGLDLRVEPADPGPPLAPFPDSVNRVLRSGVVAGIAAKLQLTSAVALHYGVSSFDDAPAQSEYIVIVSAAQSE